MISEQLRDITGAFNISDDVIVYGKTQDDHHKALRAVFQKFADISLTLNKSIGLISLLCLSLDLFSPK